MNEHARVRAIFNEAAELSGAERDSYLDEACRDEPEVRARVEALLAAAEREDDFLSSPTSPGAHWQDEAGATLETPVPVGETPTLIDRPESSDAATMQEGPGAQIGPYKLLQSIGEGGFGSVFMAEQREPVQRKVALKIIKLGMDTRQVVARFEQERQALALMDHSNIAKVFDAGATETGRPYFVMELCTGEPITTYCDRHNLSVRERLDLFAQVCSAVQHAHQKGLIHRDIKPSNVLVGAQDGRPHAKVIDFGIAKATAAKLTEKTLFTEHRTIIGTPEYMSPEQAEGSLDIDTRTDVYSLGVLLYELLTGATPFDSRSLRSAAYAEIQRIIREVDPPNPSTRLSQSRETIASVAASRHSEPKKLSAIIRGELDWIVMKALEKERHRRYESAAGLRLDIERYLGGEAVVAAPMSRVYRARKFVRRNKGAVTAAGVVALALVLGLAGTLWQAHRVSAQRDLAIEARLAETHERERAEAAEADALARAKELELVADFQAGQLSAIEPEAMGANLRRSLIGAAPEAERDALAAALAPINFTNLALSTLQDNIFERTIEAIDSQFESQPLVRARLLQTVANTLRTLGLLDLATDPQERALAIRREQLGDDHPDTLSSLNSMGVLLSAQGKPAEAEVYYREAIEGNRRVRGDDHPSTLSSLNNMGALLQAQGKLAEAEPYHREALEGRRRVLGDDHPDTLNSLNNMSVLLQEQGKPAEAEAYLREALEGRRRVLGDDHPDTLSSLNNMGFLLQAQGKLAEAEPYLREALERSRRVRGDDHPSTLSSINNMGALLRTKGKLAEAEPYLREALERSRRVRGDDHPSTLSSLNNMGFLLRAQGKMAEAEAYLREALEGRQRVLGDDHPSTLGSINNMGRLLQAQGKLAEAEPYLREALEGRRRVLGDDHLDTLSSLNSMGVLLSAQGKPSEAEVYYREAIEGNRRVLGDDHPSTLSSLNNMGALLRSQGKLAEAEPYYREALDGFRRVLGEDHPNTLVAVRNLSLLLSDLSRGGEALELADEAVATGRRVLGDDHPITLDAVNSMGVLLREQGNFAEAEVYLRKALEARRLALGDEHPDTLISLYSLARLLIRMELFEEAEELAIECEQSNRERYGEDHAETHLAIALLADLYTAWHEADSEAGHDTKAEKWRASLEPAP